MDRAIYALGKEIFFTYLKKNLPKLQKNSPCYGLEKASFFKKNKVVLVKTPGYQL